MVVDLGLLGIDHCGSSQSGNDIARPLVLNVNLHLVPLGRFSRFRSRNRDLCRGSSVELCCRNSPRFSEVVRLLIEFRGRSIHRRLSEPICLQTDRVRLDDAALPIQRLNEDGGCKPEENEAQYRQN